MTVTPNDVARGLEASLVEDETQLLPNAEAHGWSVMDHLDPETRAKLYAAIDTGHV